jgi:hypothetical protein
MTIADFVWIAVGEALLAGTFALGILVGISLTKRISNDNRNERTTPGSYWHDAGHANSSSRLGGGAAGSTDARHEANHAKRPPR